MDFRRERVHANRGHSRISTRESLSVQPVPVYQRLILSPAKGTGLNLSSGKEAPDKGAAEELPSEKEKSDAEN